MAYPADGGMKTGVIAEWNWRTDSVFRYFGGYPAAHRRDPNFGTSYAGVAAETRGEDWLVYYNGESAVYVLDRGGRMVSRHGLPEARRRGVPAKLAERFNEMDPAAQYNAASWITGFGRLRPGLQAIVHLDEDFVGRRAQIAFDNYRIFFSLARDDLSTACVDAPFNRPLDSRPVITITGDRVLVLTQHLTSDREAVATVYDLDLTEGGCTWLKMPRLPID